MISTSFIVGLLVVGSQAISLQKAGVETEFLGTLDPEDQALASLLSHFGMSNTFNEKVKIKGDVNVFLGSSSSNVEALAKEIALAIKELQQKDTQQDCDDEIEDQDLEKDLGTGEVEERPSRSAKKLLS